MRKAWGLAGLRANDIELTLSGCILNSNGGSFDLAGYNQMPPLDTMPCPACGSPKVQFIVIKYRVADDTPSNGFSEYIKASATPELRYQVAHQRPERKAADEQVRSPADTKEAHDCQCSKPIAIGNNVLD